MNNKEIKLFFDEEFTGLNKYTTLISIGIISENNKTFYAEFSDYNRTLVDKWIAENVIAKLKYETQPYYFNNDNGNIEMKSNKLNIRYELLKWLQSEFGDNILQFYADVCHYDFVLLIDLLADSARDLPKNISPSCHDINQDIAKYYNESEFNSFDRTREDIVKGIKLDTNDKHNALYDAIIAKAIYEKIKGVK
jgi:hypothetical protein